MKPRLVTSEPHEYDPRLIGQVLASPSRRAFAMAVDLVLVFIPTLIVALGVSWLVLRQSDPVALHAMLGIFHPSPAATMPETAEATAARQGETLAFWRAMAPLLTRIEAPGLPHAAAAAVEEGRLDDAAAALKDYSLDFVLTAPEFEPELHPRHIRCEIAALIPRGVRTLSILGVPALYFTLFLRGRRGATFGKRLAGIRVARMDGHRLDLLEALERFVGYLHIPGTLGYSLTDLWRDPNRRLPHDRVVNTVVLRVEHAKPKVAVPADRDDDDKSIASKSAVI
ncbi:MAG: RDD family protein [Acidobacteriota bacterium]